MAFILGLVKAAPEALAYLVGPAAGLLVRAGVGRDDADALHAPEARFEVGLHGVEYYLLGGLHAVGHGEGVELVALNLEHGLDAQHRAQGRRRGGYAPAATQVFERVDRYVYARREPFLLEYGRGLRRGIAQAQQLHGVEDRLALRGGDALVVHNRDAPVIVPGERARRGAGAAQSA